MRGLVLRPSGAQGRVLLEELPEPPASADDLLVDGIAVGVCGTDRGLVARGPRRLPEGRDRLVLGHESLGRVRRAPPGSRFVPGDLVVGLVRRPDPVPCPSCAVGESDLCRTGDYTERGILGRDGYAAERYLLAEPYAVDVPAALGMAGVLVEPTSIVAKAWERLDAAVSRPGGRALVLGAGPIGLLAALLARQRDYDVCVVDQVTNGPKVRQVEALGAHYLRGVADVEAAGFDVVVECTGELVPTAMEATCRGGALCLVAGGHRSGAASLEVAALSGALVGGNRTFLGVTSSNRHHFELARTALVCADRGWLNGLMTTLVSVDEYAAAFDGGRDTIKAVIRLAA